mmetsp:Transcript_28315/g.68820  ORF Transcript_28315/g.68820 Transcript_28315/m.68820 type:complete len:251 (-) Transcript_28315:482-1234(-)
MTSSRDPDIKSSTMWVLRIVTKMLCVRTILGWSKLTLKIFFSHSMALRTSLSPRTTSIVLIATGSRVALSIPEYTSAKVPEPSKSDTSVAYRSWSRSRPCPGRNPRRRFEVRMAGAGCAESPELDPGVPVVCWAMLRGDKAPSFLDFDSRRVRDLFGNKKDRPLGSGLGSVRRGVRVAATSSDSTAACGAVAVLRPLASEVGPELRSRCRKDCFFGRAVLWVGSTSSATLFGFGYRCVRCGNSIGTSSST